MIRGIGIDIAETGRFAKMEERLLSRIFTPSELSRAPLRRAEYFASRFAAKEAFSKAMGTGLRGFSLSEVSVEEDDAGRPFLLLSGRAEKLAEGMRLHLSLSHEKSCAVAMVVAEDEE